MTSWRQGRADRWNETSRAGRLASASLSVRVRVAACGTTEACAGRKTDAASPSPLSMTARLHGYRVGETFSTGLAMNRNRIDPPEVEAFSVDLVSLRLSYSFMPRISA